MQAKLSNDVVSIVENDNATELWHKRLKHISDKKMAQLVKKRVIRKKAYKSRNAVFIEDQTIKDVDKVQKAISESDDNSTDLDLILQQRCQGVPQRSYRTIKRSTKYPSDEYVLLINGGELESFEKAMNDEHKLKWLEAMQDDDECLHASLNLEVEQMDVKTTLLHGELEEEIYMSSQREKGKEDYVYKLHKSLYGLK
ncbi:hypothetical protein GH714_009135 [Hevea brasiliensis]|uniref:GAG-pre-integrase domain-containing protein n=1 Tax=Hevea brasiliensis TaxID=3981 RepID=A0A6A6MZQ3_HEVBR|nr:hypothetical protein GH714_009135 [Hevea brasiliensis]